MGEFLAFEKPLVGGGGPLHAGASYGDRGAIGPGPAAASALDLSAVFDDCTDPLKWELIQAPWVHNVDRFSIDGSQGATVRLDHNTVDADISELFDVVVEVEDYVAGTCQIQRNLVQIDNITADGTYLIEGVAGSLDLAIGFLADASFDGSIVNLGIFQKGAYGAFRDAGKGSLTPI